MNDPLLNNIGIQLFSLPKMLEADFAMTLKMLGQMGYREIELFGPYPFSASSAVESWQAITPMLGFSGSGFFGQSAVEARQTLDEASLQAVAMHTDLDTLHQHMHELGEAATTLGVEYVGIAAVPEPQRKTLEDYKKVAHDFNQIGASAQKVGLKFFYHNHGYGLQEQQGQIPMKIILDETDPELVFFEMDLYWTTAGGADPIAYLQEYPDRYRLMHIKDMREKVQFSGNGSNPQEWMELFPYMTPAGDGVLDLSAILPVAKEMGVKHFLVEQDLAAHPKVALKRSIDYLRSL